MKNDRLERRTYATRDLRVEDGDAPVIRGYRMLPHFIELDLAALTTALDFYETRPGLFAYYVDPADAVPAALSALPSEIQPPFYVVYFQPEDAPDEREGRVVTLVEHPVEVSG